MERNKQIDNYLNPLIFNKCWKVINNMELKNVRITKIGNKDKPSAYLPIKRKVFVDSGLSFDKAYDVVIEFKEIDVANADVVNDDKEASQ